MRFITSVVLASTVAAAALLSFAAPVRAQTFGFEGQNASVLPITTYTETQNGVLFTLRRENNRGFNVTNNIPGIAPASFGSHSLTPYLNQTNSAFIGSFSTTLSGVSISFGDFNPLDNDTFTLQAFSGINGTGTLVGSTTVNYGFGSSLPGDVGVASLSGLSGFQSIRFIGGGVLAPNSVFYDNISVQPVPEPGEIATWSALGVTLTLGIVRGRRRGARKA